MPPPNFYGTIQLSGVADLPEKIQQGGRKNQNFRTYPQYLLLALLTRRRQVFPVALLAP